MPLSVDEIGSEVPGLAPSTVYRTLAALEDLASSFTPTLITVCVVSAEAHDEGDSILVCQRRGNRQVIVGSDLSTTSSMIVARYSFHPIFAHSAFSGLCDSCHDDSPLDEAVRRVPRSDRVTDLDHPAKPDRSHA